MLQNLESVANLKGLARAKARDYDTKTVNPALIAEALADGWQIAKKNWRSVRLKRNKSNQALLEDRVWTLLYRMGFPFLSVAGGGALFNPKDSESESSRISVVGINEDIALGIDCLSIGERKDEPAFLRKLLKLSALRPLF